MAFSSYMTIVSLLASLCPSQAQIILGQDLLTITQLDPVISPGTVSGHMHCISGGSKFGSVYTPEIAASSSCTTAPFAQDKSNYWTPCLYFEWNTGGYTLVPHGGINAYYLNRPGGDKIEPWPVGFQMASGNPSRRDYNKSRLVDMAMSFVCLDSSQGIQQHGMLDAGRNCSGGWRVQINMPQCWDGVNLKSADNSHVSYASQVDNGPCPKSHPHHLISLFYEFFYFTGGNNQQKRLGMTAENGRFVLASGDPTGYGMHGDFTNGWDQDLLTAMVEQCFGSDVLKKTPNAGIRECAPLQNATRSKGKCKPDGQYADAPTGLGTKLPALPGCNPVTNTTGPPATCPGQGTPLLKNYSNQTIEQVPGDRGPSNVGGGGSGGTTASSVNASSSASTSMPSSSRSSGTSPSAASMDNAARVKGSATIMTTVSTKSSMSTISTKSSMTSSMTTISTKTTTTGSPTAQATTRTMPARLRRARQTTT